MLPCYEVRTLLDRIEYDSVTYVVPGRALLRSKQNAKKYLSNDHSKRRILVYSRLENQRIWPLVVTAPIRIFHGTSVHYEHECIDHSYSTSPYKITQK